jgi:hypothetical protein
MRITTGYKLAGTKSFRRAAAQIFGVFGTNLQNPSHTLMGACEPDPGKVFLQADQSGAEARCVAYEADAGNYRDLFEVGIKPHTYIALQIFIEKFRGSYPKDRYWFKKPKELKELPEWKELNSTIKDSDREYSLGKLVCHAASYDMKWKTFQINVLEKSNGNIRLSVQDSKFYLEMFGVLFPEILSWQRKIKNQLLASRTLVNLFGYQRTFYGRWNESLVREGYSWIPQSTIGLITSMAICDMDDYIESNKLNWDILNDKHDSMLVQCPIAEAQDCANKMKEFLGRKLTSTTGLSYNMEVEVAKGLSWDKKSKRNPEGLTAYA